MDCCRCGNVANARAAKLTRLKKIKRDCREQNRYRIRFQDLDLLGPLCFLILAANREHTKASALKNTAVLQERHTSAPKHQCFKPQCIL